MNDVLKITLTIQLILLAIVGGVELAFFDYYSVGIAFVLMLAYICIYLAMGVLFFKKRGTKQATSIVLISYFMIIFKIFFCILISYGIMKLQNNAITLFSFLIMFASIQCAGLLVFLVKRYGNK